MTSKFSKRMSSMLVRRNSTRPASPSPLSSPPKNESQDPIVPQSDSPPSGSPVLAPTQGSGRPASIRSMRSIRSLFGKQSRSRTPIPAAEPVANNLSSEALTSEPESIKDESDAPIPVTSTPAVDAAAAPEPVVLMSEPEVIPLTTSPIEQEPPVEQQPIPEPAPVEAAPEVKAPEPEPLEEEPVVISKPVPEPEPVPEAPAMVPEPRIEEPEEVVASAPEEVPPPPQSEPTPDPKVLEPIVTVAQEESMHRRTELSPVLEEQQLPSAIPSAIPAPEPSTSAIVREPSHSDASVQTEPEATPTTTVQRQGAIPGSNRKSEELTGMVWLTSRLMRDISVVLARVVHFFRPVA